MNTSVIFFSIFWSRCLGHAREVWWQWRSGKFSHCFCLYPFTIHSFIKMT